MISLLAVPTGAVRFIGLGDWGGAGLGSYYATTVGKVASTMASTASDNNVAFVINTGDNFYYCGITNTSDPQM